MIKSQMIDIRASDQEWKLLFEWVEETTQAMLDFDYPNPWFTRPLSEEDLLNLRRSSYGWFPGIGMEDGG